MFCVQLLKNTLIFKSTTLHDVQYPVWDIDRSRDYKLVGLNKKNTKQAALEKATQSFNRL